VVDVRIQLRQGERLALFGPSGAGKSTVLSCISGFELPDGGTIQLNDSLLHPPARPLHLRGLGYLTQSDMLFPHLSVAANVCFAAQGKPSGDDREWIDNLRERLGLTPFWNAPAGEISGGQARRVALARMLVRRPPLILLDEPFAALDAETTDDLLDALMEWHSGLNFTLIAVDHRPEILRRMCDKVAVIEAGRVVQRDSWQRVVRAPVNATIGRMLRAG
jgi:ABC-type sulfate/molybdate transport systems ATPase subunit